jgi:membrane protein required for colicin V production
VTPLPIQPYDMVMLAVLVLATLFGLWKGMAWQIASVASVAVSFVVAVRMSGVVAPMISAQEPWNRFIAMLLLYLATSAGIWLAFRLVAGIIDRVRLKEFDRQIGALFGLAKGAMLCVVITFFAVTLSETLRQNVLNTYSGRTIAVLIKRTSPIMPPEVLKVLGTYIDELDRKLAPEAPPAASPPTAPPRAPQRPAPRITAEIEGPAEAPAASPAPLSLPDPPTDWAPAAEPAPRFVPAPASDPAPRFEARDQDSQIPLFPVRNASRDRT